jgi:pyroglutamyl-peptidase
VARVAVLQPLASGPVNARLLLTAFEPFGGASVNSSLEALRAVERQPPDGVELETAELPVVWGRARERLAEIVDGLQVDAVVALGQTDEGVVGVERIAVNLDDAKEDNAGVTADAEPIVADGPPAYWSTLPVREIVDRLRAAGIPAVASRDAGGYLCNHLFYGLMHLLATEGSGAIGGFVHVPQLPQQVLESGEPSLPLETSVRAVELVLAETARVCASAHAQAEHVV